MEKQNRNVQTQAGETSFNSMYRLGGWQTPWEHGRVVMDETISSFQPCTGQGEGVSATGLHLATHQEVMLRQSDVELSSCSGRVVGIELRRNL